MPIIGIIASSRRPSAMELIENKTLSAYSNGVTFASIPQTYTHLRLIVNGKGSSTAYYYGHVYLRFNGVGTSSYGSIKNQAYNSDWTSSYGEFGNYPGTTLDAGYYVDSFSGTANMFGPCVIEIPNYKDTGKNKATTSTFGFMTNLSTGQDRSTTGFDAGVSFLTTAISEIFVNNYGSGWVAGSTFSLYGLKG